MTHASLTSLDCAADVIMLSYAQSSEFCAEFTIEVNDIYKFICLDIFVKMVCKLVQYHHFIPHVCAFSYIVCRYVVSIHRGTQSNQQTVK